MKIALVQDWLTSCGGAEKCIEAACEIWPEADIFTLVYKPELFGDSLISKHQVIPSGFIQRLPWSRKLFRHYFMLYPFAVEQYDFRPYDVVISFSAAFSHGILTRPEQLHICYKHTPMRYAWSGYHEYLEDPHIRRKWKQMLTRIILHRLRKWDYLAAQRPNLFLANSQEVRRRIRHYYRRDALVVHPPVEITKEAQASDGIAKEDYYITLGRMVPYKKTDLVVETFTELPDKRLIVAGEGPEYARLRKIAQDAPNIEFLGFIDEAKKLELLSKARAFVFGAFEDFGIAPVEPQTFGTPVIAYGRGGALETVLDGQTGVLFEEQTKASLHKALERFDRIRGDLVPSVIRQHARKFDKEVFKQKLQDIVAQQIAQQQAPVAEQIWTGSEEMTTAHEISH